jgi:hypothetical protein
LVRARIFLRICFIFERDMLYLREGSLDGIQVRRVGWQVDELASPLFYEIPHPPWPVRSEIVHHHNLPWLEGRSQQALHLRLQHSSIGRSLQGKSWSHPFLIDARQQRRVLATVCGDLEEGSLAYGRIGIQRSQGGMGAHLVLKNTRRPGSIPPTSMRHRLLKNSSLSAAPVDLFFGSCALAQPPDKPSLRSPKPPRERIQELGSLGVSSPRPLLEVF